MSNPNPCRGCGTPITGRRSDARWCSEACRMHHYRTERRASLLGVVAELAEANRHLTGGRYGHAAEILARAERDLGKITTAGR